MLKVRIVANRERIDIGLEGGEHGTPLQAAAFGHRLGIIELLLNEGADVNAPGDKP